MTSWLVAVLVAASFPARAQVADDKPALDALFDGMRQAGDVDEAPRAGPGSEGFVRGLGRWAPPGPGPAPAAAAAPPAVSDSDGDGMDDDEELRVAKAVAPTLVWARGEGCGEHDVLFQVHPHGDGLARVTYVLLFPIDCGFHSGGIGGHSGDVQEMMIEAVRTPEGAWRADTVDLPWHRPFKPRTGAALYVSSGKHHIYPSKESCGWGKFLFFDDCDGGVVEHLALLQDRNVGEASHPAFISLAAFARGPWAAGYADETAWGPSAKGDAYFCGGDPERGGLGSRWARIKKRVGWDSCGDAAGGKWAVEPTPAVPVERDEPAG